MNKVINTILQRTSYPIFESNQVLTQDELNHVVEYLEEQNRLTRAYLIGMGIVCGLEVKVQTVGEKTEIQISAGCGITSEGFCIQYTPITDEENAEKKNIFTHYRDNVSLAKNLFIPSESPTDNYIVRELITAAEADTQLEDIHLLTEINKNDLQQVLVILYEWQDEAQQDFFQFNYDDRRKERSFRLRFLLLPSKDTKTDIDLVNLSAERLLRQGYQLDQLPEPWKGFATQEVFEVRNHFFQEFAPQVQRFGYVKSDTDESVDLTKINDYKIFRENYYLICENAIAAINNAFPKLSWLFSPFFTAFQPKSGNDFSQLKENLEYLFKGIKLENLLENLRDQEIHKEIRTLKPEQVQSTYTLQYFYDYLSLLVAAYYELAEAAFDLMDDCTPDTRRFPKFLMLGLVPSPGQATEVYAPPSAYRSHFTQPPIYNNNQARVQQVRYLYERLLKLCAKDSFYLLPFYSTPLKITPSKDRSAPLSEQAIPYYFNYLNLYKYWNYNAYRKGRSNRHPAYFYPKNDLGENSHVFNDLSYRLDAYNFYRIEGHIGKANGDALKHIQEYRQRYNLAFDVISLKLGSQNSIQEMNLSGKFDDLEVDFILIKYTFQQLWNQYQTGWSKNVFMQTLKRYFFDQPNLKSITSSQLFNLILNYARQPKNYEFIPVEPQNPTNTKFQLYLRDDSNQRIARYVTQPDKNKANSFDDFNNVILDFAGLSPDAIAEKKQRIVKEKAQYFSHPKVTYGIVKDSANYYLKLLIEPETKELSPTAETSSLSDNDVIVLISLNYFNVSVEPKKPPIISQPEFHNFEILYGLLRDVPETFNASNTDNYEMGNKKIAEQLNYSEFNGLFTVYQQRLEPVIQQHLFNKFAEQHPGMEHLGGVPKGGTFILVYVDGQDAHDLLVVDQDLDNYQEANKRIKKIQEAALLPPSFPDELPAKDLISSLEKLLPELQKRENIVVADFCVPYRCISDITSASYVVTRSRLIILLEKNFFCEGDGHKYQFTLEPKDGTLKGEGVLVEESKQFFQPSSIDQASKDILAKGQERTITFTYTVDNTIDTLTVTIYPLPRPNLSITEGQNFCHNGKPVEITLGEGTPENVELIEVKVNGIKTKTLEPSLYAAVDKQQVIIEALIRSKQTQCENTLTRTVIINPLPVAELSITEGQNFCHNGKPVEITLGEGTPENVELIEVKVNGIKTKTLEPSLYAAVDKQQVIIEALIRSKQTQCENTLTRTIVVNPTPTAELTITEGQNFCHNTGTTEITLKAGTPENIELIQVTINGKETRTLDTSLFATSTQAEPVNISALIRNQQTQCQNTITRNITVNPLPVADFQTEITNINAQGFSVRVFNIQPADKSCSFVWEHPNGSSNISNPGNNEFLIRYDYDFNTWVDSAVVSITLRVNAPPNLGGCHSEPVTKNIAIPFGGVVGFNLLSMNNNQVINTTRLESDRTFKISDFNANYQYAIAANTVPAKVDNIVFSYTAPGDTSDSKQINVPYLLPDGWERIVGIHRIQAKPIRVINGTRIEGVASTVIIRIDDSEPDTPNTPNPAPTNLLNRIVNGLRKNGQDNGEPKALSRNDEPKRSLVSNGVNLSNEFKIKPIQVVSFSTATLLLIAGWSLFSSTQSQNQQHSPTSTPITAEMGTGGVRDLKSQP